MVRSPTKQYFNLVTRVASNALTTKKAVNQPYLANTTTLKANMMGGAPPPTRRH
jgi:hypothetical protein